MKSEDFNWSVTHCPTIAMVSFDEPAIRLGSSVAKLPWTPLRLHEAAEAHTNHRSHLRFVLLRAVTYPAALRQSFARRNLSIPISCVLHRLWSRTGADQAFCRTHVVEMGGIEPPSEQLSFVPNYGYFFIETLCQRRQHTLRYL